MPKPDIRFGRFELRPATRELRAHGQALRIGERAFDLLLALVQAGGRPVSRDALFEHAWPGRAVLDDNQKVQVMALRRLLGRDAVATVLGAGLPATRGCGKLLQRGRVVGNRPCPRHRLVSCIQCKVCAADEFVCIGRNGGKLVRPCSVDVHRGQE